MEDLLTINQVAIILKVHPLTIRRYIKEERLLAVKLGGNIRIAREELEKFSQSYNLAKKTTAPIKPNSNFFSPNDPLFRLRGRGAKVK